MKVVSKRKLSLIKRVLNKNPLANSKKIFDDAGIGSVSRSTRCKVLRHLGKYVKPDIRPPLKSSHKMKHVEWTQTYMKVNFQMILFTDECRATLNGPNGWSKGWVGNDRHRPLKLRRQPGGGGVVLLAGIIGSELVGPWRVLEGVKLTAETYINFLKNNFAPWYIRKLLALKRKMIFMQDNAPSNVTKKTGEYLIRVGFKNGRPM